MKTLALAVAVVAAIVALPMTVAADTPTFEQSSFSTLGGSAFHGTKWPPNTTMVIGCDDGTGANRVERQVQTDGSGKLICPVDGLSHNGWVFLKNFAPPLGCTSACDIRVGVPPAPPVIRIPANTRTGWKVFKFLPRAIYQVGKWIFAEAIVEPGSGSSAAEYASSSDLVFSLSPNSRFTEVPSFSTGPGLVLGTPVLSPSGQLLTVPVVSDAPGADDLSMEPVMVELSPSTGGDIAVVTVQATIRFRQSDGTLGPPETVVNECSFASFFTSATPALPGWAGIALAGLLLVAGIFVFGKRRAETQKG